MPWDDKIIIAYRNGAPRGYAHCAHSTLGGRPILALRFLDFDPKETDLGRSLLREVDLDARARSLDTHAFEPWTYERLFYDTRSLSVRAAHVRALMLESGYDVKLKYFTHVRSLDGDAPDASGEHPWSWGESEIRVNGPGRALVLAEKGQERGRVVVRFPSGGESPRRGGFAFISWLTVDRAARGRGLGSRLVDKALSVASSMGFGEMRCVVKADNVPALLMFARAGFTVSDARFDGVKIR